MRANPALRDWSLRKSVDHINQSGQRRSCIRPPRIPIQSVLQSSCRFPDVSESRSHLLTSDLSFNPNVELIDGENPGEMALSADCGARWIALSGSSTFRRIENRFVCTKRSRGGAFDAAIESPGGPRILFAAGGTGGHVYPALAIADELQKLSPGASIHFVGTRERMEWEIIPKAGYAISPIPAVAIQRPFYSIANLLLPFRLLRCLWLSWQIVRNFQPDVVVGTGGYVAGPVCLMAALSGAVVAIQEQNAYAGLSNRILGRFAAVVFVAFAAAKAYFPSKKCVLVGNPTRAVLREPIDRGTALRSFFDAEFSGREEVIVVMGGSLGARLINEATAAIALSLLEQNPNRFIIWQTGRVNYDDTLNRVGAHPRLAVLS